MSDELLDIYDENLRHIGVKPRAAVHRDGDWHRVFHCWVVYRDATGGDRVILQRRGPDKLIYPNKLDVTVGGHYAAGESVADGVREIEEELGIQIPFAALVPVGVRVSVSRYNGLIDREFADNFLLLRDAPLHSYAYQRDEIAGLVCLSIDDALALFAGDLETISAEAVGLDTANVQVRVGDFIAAVDQPFYKALVVAKRFLDGEKHLLI